MQGMEGIELYIDDEGLIEFCEELQSMQLELESIHDSLNSLANAVENSVAWKRNGKETTSQFLSLLAVYSSYIAGISSAVSIGTDFSTFMAEKSVQGGDDHIINLENAIKEFTDVSNTFECGGTAECVRLLDAIQGD